MPKLATIDLDWLDSETEKLNTNIQELIKKKIENHGESRFREIENRLDLLSHELLVLHNLRKKCIPINEQKEPELPNYCVVKNKEYCFLSGKCKECSEEPKENPYLDTNENAINSGFMGMKTREPGPLFKLAEQDPNEGIYFPNHDKVEVTTSDFLSKTCINDWESNQYCANSGKCELCKIK